LKSDLSYVFSNCHKKLHNFIAFALVRPLGRALGTICGFPVVSLSVTIRRRGRRWYVR